MSTLVKWIIAIVIIFILVLIYFNRNAIKSWWSNINTPIPNPYKDCLAKNKALAEDAPCVVCFDQSNWPPGMLLGANVAGTIKNGVCIGTAEAQNNPPASTQNLQVSNPNGAFMYYQQSLPSGGILYSKSNVKLLPGTKLVLLDTVQNTSQFGKYFYETDYKQYGVNSGFFDTADLIKINGGRQRVCWEHTGQGSHQVPCKN